MGTHRASLSRSRATPTGSPSPPTVHCPRLALSSSAGAFEWVKANAKFMQQEFTAQGGLFQAGADWAPNVVVAGNLITAQNPGSAKACGEAVIAALA